MESDISETAADAPHSAESALRNCPIYPHLYANCADRCDSSVSDLRSCGMQGGRGGTRVLVAKIPVLPGWRIDLSMLRSTMQLQHTYA